MASSSPTLKPAQWLVCTLLVRKQVPASLLLSQEAFCFLGEPCSFSSIAWLTWGYPLRLSTLVIIPEALLCLLQVQIHLCWTQMVMVTYYFRWGLTSVLYRVIRITLPAENLSPEACICHLPLSWPYLRAHTHPVLNTCLSCLFLLPGMTLISTLFNFTAFLLLELLTSPHASSVSPSLQSVKYLLMKETGKYFTFKS